MKKYLFLIWAVASLWACNKEDWPDNSIPERNWFLPDEGATDETSMLRREFYERNGVYLFFSDTLGVREKTSLAGNTVYEWQILGYDMLTSAVSYDSVVYHPYMDYAEQKAAARFLEESVFPEIASEFWSNGVLLYQQVQFFKYSWWPEGFDDPVDLYSQPMLQAMIFAVGDVAHASAEEKARLKNTLLQAMVLDKAALLPAEELEPFFNYSKDYYDLNGYLIPDKQAVGLLVKIGDYLSATSKDYDLAAFIERIFLLPKAEFYVTFADYPLVIKKMEVLVEVLQKHGVKIYME